MPEFNPPDFLSVLDALLDLPASSSLQMLKEKLQSNDATSSPKNIKRQLEIMKKYGIVNFSLKQGSRSNIYITDFQRAKEVREFVQKNMKLPPPLPVGYDVEHNFCYFNKQRIKSIFNEFATPLDVEEVKATNFDPMFGDEPFEQMMKKIITRRHFLDFWEHLRSLDTSNGGSEAQAEVAVTTDRAFDTLAAKDVVIWEKFTSHGLRSPDYYRKNGVSKLPYLSWKPMEKIGGRRITVTMELDPKNIRSDTGYSELMGRHTPKLLCYGLIKRVRVGDAGVDLHFSPLAISLS